MILLKYRLFYENNYAFLHFADVFSFIESDHGSL